MIALESLHRCGTAPHDRFGLIATSLVIVGLVASYLPQHYRIVRNRTSEGISPWYLLLGSTSAASSLLNIIVLQWHVVRCCSRWGPGGCFENLLGILQIGLQWFSFNVSFILFLVYFPQHRKFVHVVATNRNNSAISDHRVSEAPSDSLWTRIRTTFYPSTGDHYITERSSPSPSRSGSVSVDESHGHSTHLANLLLSRSSIALSADYRASIFAATFTVAHALLCTLVTFILLVTLPRFSDSPAEDDPDPLPAPGDEHNSVRAVRIWATTLGLLSTVLALMQYLPQILLTARTRLVGSLSIPMMCIQAPGSFVFVYTIAIRPGVDWTTYIVFVITGCLQFALLFMCIAGKARQRRLGIDDFGKRLADHRGDADERSALLRPGASAATR